MALDGNPVGDLEFNILLSSAGRRVHLLHILETTLSDIGLTGTVFVADASPLAAAFHRASERFIVPRCDDPSFVEHMLHLCAQHEIRLIIPTIDPELPIYSANRHRFDKIGTALAISGPRTVEIAGDKVVTHQWFQSNGIPTVAQTSVSGVLAERDEWHFPLLVKPRFGSAGKGVKVMAGPEELKNLPEPETYLVQSIAEGVEYTVDVFVDREGVPRCAVPRRRIEVRAGEVSKGMTARLPEVEDLALKLAADLPDASGPLTVQVFHDEATGELKAIEMNPRFGGGFPLAWEAGAHFPQWLIEELLGLSSAADRYDEWRPDMLMLRYDDAVFVDASSLSLSS